MYACMFNFIFKFQLRSGKVDTENQKRYIHVNILETKPKPINYNKAHKNTELHAFKIFRNHCLSRVV